MNIVAKWRLVNVISTQVLLWYSIYIYATQQKPSIVVMTVVLAACLLTGVKVAVISK